MSKAESSVLFDAPGPRARRNILVLNVIGTLVVAGIGAWVVWSLAGKGQFTVAKWESFLTADLWVYYFLPGIWSTLKAALLAIVTSNVLGIALGLGRLSTLAPVRWVSTAIVEFFRAVPVLVMMLFAYYMLSTSGLVDPTTAPFWGVVVGLTLYNGAVIAELVRSGVSGLPRGQREAALALGLSRGKSLRIVELPQALIAMMPSMVSQLVVILKDTALGYLINYPELLRQARLAGTSYSNLLPGLIVAGIVFIVINYSLTWFAGVLAKRLSGSTAGSAAVAAAEVPGLPGPDMETVPEGAHVVHGAPEQHDHRFGHPRE